jgi:hypothetical protein
MSAVFWLVRNSNTPSEAITMKASLAAIDRTVISGTVTSARGSKQTP